MKDFYRSNAEKKFRLSSDIRNFEIMQLVGSESNNTVTVRLCFLS